MKHARRLALIFCLGFLAGPATGVQADPLEASGLFRAGTIETGVAASLWQATTAIGNAPTANRTAVAGLAHLGLVVTDTVGPSWARGSLMLYVEPIVGRFTKPFAAELLGATIGAKYRFYTGTRWIPFWEGGAGVSWTNLAPRISEQSLPMEFLLQTGPGTDVVLDDHLFLTIGVRLHHISNGGLGERNTGLNAWMPYIGLSWTWPK